MLSMINPSLSDGGVASASGAAAFILAEPVPPAASWLPAFVRASDPVPLVCGACSTATPHAVRNKRPASSLNGPVIDDI